MAKATNALTQGLSGKVSGLVFRRNANGTVSVGDAPRPSTKEPNAATLARRQRFQEAAFYGRAVQQDPAIKAAYETAIDANNTSAHRRRRRLPQRARHPQCGLLRLPWANR